ncbi:MAG: hypothetical protein ACE5HX_11900 [bacterium]
MPNKVENINRWEILRQSVKRILKPKIIQEWTALWKKIGFWGLVKQKGWKIVVAIILFYLIRDTFLYLLLPYLVARGLLGD